MKTNFKPTKIVKHDNNQKAPKSGDKKDFTREEFDDYILKSGALGSYMIYRSENKKDELGIEEL